MSKLLIATIKKLVCWDNKQINLRDGNYYGLTWDNDCFYASHNPKDEPVSLIEVFDKDFKFFHHLPIPDLNAVHQIYSWGDKLYITNVLKDRIEVWDKVTQSISNIHWTDTDTRDKHHINSFWANEEYFYACESGLGGIPPAIQMLDYYGNSAERIELPEAVHIHNVYIENDTVFSCGKFGLIVKELNGNRCRTIDLRIDEINGFFRGLARTKDHFFIGESQELPREKREFGDSRILILDNDLQLVDTIELVDTGQVQDIRVISGDLAHNGVEW